MLAGRAGLRHRGCRGPDGEAGVGVERRLHGGPEQARRGASCGRLRHVSRPAAERRRPVRDAALARDCTSLLSPEMGGRNVAALFIYVRHTMPPDAPGTLTDEQSIDAIAHMLTARRLKESANSMRRAVATEAGRASPKRSAAARPPISSSVPRSSPIRSSPKASSPARAARRSRGRPRASACARAV